MNNSNSILLAGAIVIIGRWTQDKPMTARITVGIFVLALFITILADSQPKLGRQFSLLILIVAVFGYAPSILNAIGYKVQKQ
jgi:hypothetical protein